jgi:hypothetical protein
MTPVTATSSPSFSSNETEVINLDPLEAEETLDQKLSSAIALTPFNGINSPFTPEARVLTTAESLV